MAEMKIADMRFARIYWRNVFCAALMLGAALPLPACAQLPGPLPGAVQPGRDRPAPATPSQPDFDFRIEGARRSSVASAADQLHFTLKDVQITGAHVLPVSSFRVLYEKFLGKEIALSDILDVADQIEQSYRNEGYLLVRAYVPPQRVRDGVFTINVVEGKIAHVAVEGGQPGTQEQVRGYMAKTVGVTPLHEKTMERALLLSNDLPGVTASGVLRPSDQAGASDIVVSLDEPRFTGGLGLDNRGSRFSGLWTLNADAEVNSLFGDDQLAASLTTSPDASEQIASQLRYRRAVGDDGVVASMIGTITHGQPGSTLQAFNVATDSWAVGPRIAYPIIRSREESLLLDGGITFQDAKVNILATRFSHDQWRVLDIGLTYLTNWRGSWLFTGDLAQGLPAFGATPDDAAILSRKGGATDFTKFSGLARFSTPLGDKFSAVLTAQGQFSFSPLINGELTSFGGLAIGRGYDPGAITGDHGIGGSAELRYDQALDNSILLSIQPYLYFDAAQTWYIQRGAAIDPALTDQSLDSVGGGIRATLAHNATLGLEVSRTLHAVTGSDAGREATKFFLTTGIRF
jgi:hemolysin activation/secretion protein